MDYNNNNSHSTGIGFTGALFLTFLTLKLLDIIDWSWWWVTAPLWGSAIILVVVIVILLITAAKGE